MVRLHGPCPATPHPGSRLASEWFVHTSLGKKLALQRVDGGPESADRLPFRVLYGLRGQNCTEKLIAAAICTPVYESALLVGIGQEKRGSTVDASQDEED